MRTMLTAATLVAVWGFGHGAVVAQPKKIDLQTKEGVAAVKGEWRYHDVKIVEVEGKGPDGKPNKTYNYEPRLPYERTFRRQQVGGRRTPRP